MERRPGQPTEQPKKTVKETTLGFVNRWRMELLFGGSAGALGIGAVANLSMGNKWLALLEGIGAGGNTTALVFRLKTRRLEAQPSESHTPTDKTISHGNEKNHHERP